MQKILYIYIGFILAKVTLTAPPRVAVNARSRLSDMTVHTRSRPKDINIRNTTQPSMP